MEAGRRQIERGTERATGFSKEAAGTGRTVTSGGATSRTGLGSAAQETKQQVGSFDPGMESVKTEAVAGERKAVASFRSRLGEAKRLRRAWKH